VNVGLFEDLEIEFYEDFQNGIILEIGLNEDIDPIGNGQFLGDQLIKAFLDEKNIE